MAEKSVVPAEGEGSEARARILDAAERLFGDQGFAAASIGEIAEAAGVNRALIYYYFKDKRDLYRSVIQTGLDALSGILDEVGADRASAREKLADFVSRSYALFTSSRAMVRIIHREVMGVGEKMDLPLGEYILRNVAKLERIIRDGIRDGEFRQVDPRLAARSLLGMLNIFITEPFVTGEAFSPRRVVRHTVELFCRGVAG